MNPPVFVLLSNVVTHAPFRCFKSFSFDNFRRSESIPTCHHSQWVDTVVVGGLRRRRPLHVGGRRDAQLYVARYRQRSGFRCLIVVKSATPAAIRTRITGQCERGTVSATLLGRHPGQRQRQHCRWRQWWAPDIRTVVLCHVRTNAQRGRNQQRRDRFTGDCDIDDR